jgi:hypothetical protein
MKALSVRAPWWWAILHGKPVENRDWHTNFRGVVLLHASKFWKIDEVSEDWDDIKDMAARDNLALPLPVGNQAAIDLTTAMRDAGGCIVGSVEIVDCVISHPSAFFVGKYGFVLRHPMIYRKPIPFKGARGFFDVPDSVVRLATVATHHAEHGVEAGR